MKRLCLALSLLCLLPCLPASADSITVQQGSTARKILFLLVQSVDHVTALTGATPTVTLSKNGAAFAAPAGAVTELANGWYVLTPTSADTGAVGSLIVHATATSGDPADVVENVVAYNPDDASLLGLTGVATATTQGTQGTTLAAVNTSASTLLLSLATYQSTLTTGSTTTALNTALTGTADLTGGKVVFTAGVNKGVARTIAAMNSTTGVITLLTGVPNTPGATDAFSVVQGSKALEQFLAGLGTDNRPVLSANAQPNIGITNALPALDGSNRVLLQPVQTGVTIPAVTTVGTLTANADKTGYTVATVQDKTGYSGVATNFTASPTVLQIAAGLPTDTSITADTQAGLTAQGLTVARAAKIDNADVATSTRSTFAGGAVASVTGAVGSVTGSVTAGNLPADYLSSAEQTSLSGASANTSALVARALPPTAAQIQAYLDANSALPGLVWSVGTRTVTGGTIGTYTGNTPQTGDAYLRLASAVVLPTTAPAGYGGAGGGSMTVSGYAAGQDPATLLASQLAAIPAAAASALMTKTVSGTGLTLGQEFVLLGLSAVKVGSITNTWNAATHILTTAYATTTGTIALTTTAQYPMTQVTSPALNSVAGALGTVPQP